MAAKQTDTSFVVETSDADSNENYDGGPMYSQGGAGARGLTLPQLFDVLPQERIRQFLQRASNPQFGVVGVFCLTRYYASLVSGKKETSDASSEEIAVSNALAVTLKRYREMLGKPNLTVYATTFEKYNREKTAPALPGVVTVEAPIFIPPAFSSLQSRSNGQGAALGYITYLAYDLSSREQIKVIEATIASVLKAPANISEVWHQHRGSGSKSSPPWVQDTRTENTDEAEAAMQAMITHMNDMTLQQKRSSKRRAP